jgi:dihydrofolate reductase (trimethoprim resistance protein)
MLGSVQVSLIAAMAANRVIGDGPRIPWRIPGEQKIFKRLTEGKVVAMGRKTLDSIGHALPNRRTVVITRQLDYVAPGCTLARNLEHAVAIAKDIGDELFVAGGAEIYALAMPIARRIHLTEIHQDFAGDAYFPNFSASEFRRISSEEVAATIPYSYSIYERQSTHTRAKWEIDA